MHWFRLLLCSSFCFWAVSCGDEEPATVSIQNAFNDPAEVAPGFDFVLMVGSRGDPSCPVETSLPLASRVREETVPGQTRTIVISLQSKPLMGSQWERTGSSIR